MKFEFEKKEMRYLLIEEWENECFIYETNTGVIICMVLHSDGEQSDYDNDHGRPFRDLDDCERFVKELFDGFDDESN